MNVPNSWIIYIGTKKILTWIHEINEQCIECFVNKKIYMENKNDIIVLYQQKKVYILKVYFDENFNILQLIIDKNKKINNVPQICDNSQEKKIFIQKN